MRSTGRDQRGSMAVEVVILAPVLMMFALLVVAGGRYVAVQGDIEAAARDAARAASLESTRGAAEQAARSAIAASLDGSHCTVGYNAAWEPDGSVRVTLRCQVPYDDLGLLGLPGSVTVEADSQVRLDPYRRFE